MELISESPQQLLALLNSVPSDAWGVVIETIVSAFVVSPLALGLKKWLSVDSEHKMLGLVILGSIVAGLLDYLHGVALFAPYFALVQGWLVFGTTQPVYRWFVKPLAARISSGFTGSIITAKQLADVQSAEVPADGVPAANFSQ
jgi:hypothetical protein